MRIGDGCGRQRRAVKAGEIGLAIAAGVESMSRASFVMGKSDTAFGRNVEIYDTTIGWRFVNKVLQKQYGIDSKPETAENVAEQFDIDRKSRLRTNFRCAVSSVRLQHETVGSSPKHCPDWGPRFARIAV
jgi:hypothetical protein